jgi:ubiquinone/menaquinone biosynthesis C-methylase UbiE
VSFRLAPAHALPFRDESFDAVFCRLLLNHMRRPERLVRELVRVLKPGGVLVLAELLSVDNPVKRATQNAIEERRNPSHVAARSVDQYNKLITDAGLAIEAKETISFERELEEWLAAYHTDRADAVVVREMIEAGLETDAAGINARRQGNTLVFEQRMYYLKAVKANPRA